MFLNMLTFELRYFIRQPSFYVTTLIFFLAAFFASSSDNFLLGGSNVNVNSPFSILMLMSGLLQFAIFLVVNFVAGSAIRNDETNMAELIFSKPFKPFMYQLGRFLGAYSVVAIIFASVPLGIYLGSSFGLLVGWLDPELVGANKLHYYLTAYFYIAVPSLFVLAAIFNGVATYFRSMMAVYLTAVAFLIAYSTISVYFDDLAFRWIVSYADPFASGSLLDVTRYWTASDKNSQTLELTGVLLFNRLLWITLAIVIFFASGKLSSRIVIKREKKKLAASNFTKQKEAALIAYSVNHKTSASSIKQQLLLRCVFEFKHVVISAPFLILGLITLAVLMVPLFAPIGWYGTVNWPVTQNMVGIIQNAIGLLITIVIVYYSAELVWRERSSGMGDIVDSFPVHNSVFWVSKLLALVSVIGLLYTFSMILTIVVQLVKGQFNLEFGQYLFRLGYFSFLPFVMLAILAFFLQIVSANKYIGMGLFGLYYLVSIVLSNYGFSHNMFHFAQSSPAPYSDINGYGHYLTGVAWYTLYWSGLSVMLAVVGLALWHRGPSQSLRNRFAQLKYNLGRKGQMAAVLGLVVFIAVGAQIYYNTRVLNDFYTHDQLEDLQVEYEQKFVQYKDDLLPIITDVDLNVEIYPQQRKMLATANVLITNTSDQPIKRFLVSKPGHSPQWNVKIVGGEIAEQLPDYNSAWFEFTQPLMPGEVRQGEISVERSHQGFADSNTDTKLVANGTFIDNWHLFPRFGYNDNYQLTDKHERRKRGLPELQRANKLENTQYYKQSMFGANGGFINFAATITTDESQFAIAPGYLKSETVTDGRRTFRYEMDSPIINFYAILSARLESKKITHNGVNVEVYYHQDHAWNVDRMIESVTDSIDYLSAEFGPYQHKQMRIIEFPGYESFAQSFANTVPYSEKIGFITDNRDSSKIDVPYYVTAHEVAHQWWGHQIIGANVQGAAVLSESLSQYSAIMVLKKKYGEQKLRKFLKYELDKYLQGRSVEAYQEMPLYKVETQAHIYYQKGSVVMMAMHDLFGEERLNRILKEFVSDFKYQNNPYPTTLDLLSYLKRDASAAEQAFIDDQFMYITLYELTMKKAKVSDEADSDGLYTVTLTVEAAKKRADGQGEETDQALDEMIDIALFNDDPENLLAEDFVIYSQKHRLVTGTNTIELKVKEKPLFAGVDPFVKLIDKDSIDNLAKF
ncbi:ABC transporter permease/M1 family aminopeptidase [Pseudoalteromonas arctica]|uniref:Peptidase M1 membrane alanine aminopeptidase domain-containing protein n=1 Tax=Pseudoalteromonas arctica TaxID=394751 RepID=A0A7Y0DTD4_9GAMM|nr:M1 family aminopeptidase [Pseudoalteromonas arctica]NMM41327.1 hypothetical protein [Pseudoalteromonas arctica]